MPLTISPLRDRNPHMADQDILHYAVSEQAIVVTMGKYLGDLLWKEHQPHAGVILLRMEEATGSKKADAMCRIVREFGAELPQHFTVCKNDRLRTSP
jgi:predicted nuclease of predicted toxin-antitoxin system